MNENTNRTRPLGGIGEGIRTGVGVLNAFREAIEETIGEALEGSGEVTPERAKAMVRDAAQRVQSSLDETRERLDFVSRRELEELRREVVVLRERIAKLEGGCGEIVTEPPAAPEADGGEGIIVVSD